MLPSFLLSQCTLTSPTPGPTPAPTPVPPPVATCNTPAQIATLRQLTIKNSVKAARKISGGSQIVQTVTIANDEGHPPATLLFLEMDVDSDLTLLEAKVKGWSTRSVTASQDPATNFVTSDSFTLAGGASITFKLSYKVASCPNSGTLYLPARVGIAGGGPQCYVSGGFLYVSRLYCFPLSSCPFPLTFIRILTHSVSGFIPTTLHFPGAGESGQPDVPGHFLSR